MRSTDKYLWWTAGALALALLIIFQPTSQTGVRLTPIAFARSLEGTEPDGNLAIVGKYANRYNDAFANGMPYADLRRFFDYYLTTLGEKSEAQIREKINTEIDQHLPPELAQKVRTLFANYMAYRHATMIMPTLSDSSSVYELTRSRLKSLQDLRQRYFDQQEVTGLFGDDIVFENRSISHLEINNNPNYSDKKKQELIAAVDAELPAKIRESLEAPRAIIRVEDAIQALRDQGGTEQDVFALRAKEFGEAAAARFAASDKEEAAWQNRIADYRAQRQKIVDQGLSIGEQASQLSQLQKAHFNALEILRLSAYP
jgi:lipase chaperone LimK